MLILNALRDLTGLIIEFNHDVDMLLNGDYPLFLKQRVRSRQGHLSNLQAAEALRELLCPALKQVVLAHLSESNNTPELALTAAREVLSNCESQADLWAAQQGQPTRLFDLSL
jgi:phosphoribosyl 1,2-cyclic phosphodiesterase